MLPCQPSRSNVATFLAQALGGRSLKLRAPASGGPRPAHSGAPTARRECRSNLSWPGRPGRAHSSAVCLRTAARLRGSGPGAPRQPWRPCGLSWPQRACQCAIACPGEACPARRVWLLRVTARRARAAAAQHILTRPARPGPLRLGGPMCLLRLRVGRTHSPGCAVAGPPPRPILTRT